MQNRIFSTDSAKAIKARAFGYINAIHYLAPARESGSYNLCSHASPGCMALCLGWQSGQAAMVAHDDDINSVRQSRIDKTLRFMRSRADYLLDVVRSIDNEMKRAAADDMKLCVRMNGSSDIAFEGIRFTIERDQRGRAVEITLGGAQGKSIMDHYSRIAFVDYTKNPRRFDRKLPRNYHLTFSRSDDNETTALEMLARGVNVAVVFGRDKPKRWNGYRVIDGDLHDLRQLDPRGRKHGVVIALSPKGRKAKRDTSGFVIH